MTGQKKMLITFEQFWPEVKPLSLLIPGVSLSTILVPNKTYHKLENERMETLNYGKHQRYTEGP